MSALFFIRRNMKRERISGIYRIVCTVNDKVYIGQSKAKPSQICPTVMSVLNVLSINRPFYAL